MGLRSTLVAEREQLRGGESEVLGGGGGGVSWCGGG